VTVFVPGGKPLVARDIYTSKRMVRFISQQRRFPVELKRDFNTHSYYLRAVEAQ